MDEEEGGELRANSYVHQLFVKMRLFGCHAYKLMVQVGAHVLWQGLSREVPE